jgi:hypothetical protein
MLTIEKHHSRASLMGDFDWGAANHGTFGFLTTLNKQSHGLAMSTILDHWQYDLCEISVAVLILSSRFLLNMRTGEANLDSTKTRKP